MKKRSDTADGHPISMISIFVGLLTAAGLGQDAPATRPAASGPATANASAAVMPAAPTAPPLVTDLRARGYAVLPAPRQVRLEEGTVKVDRSWGLELSGLKSDDIAVRTLLAALKEHGVTLDATVGKSDPTGAARPGFKLAVRPGTVATGAEELIDRQAYLLRVGPSGIEIAGNSPAGLFYGVQTLAQLLEGDPGAPGLALPAGVIRDWPRFALRFVHWDTKHHQDRPETLRRYLDQMARFKMNAVSFELEDKFEYPTHPEIGAPGAFTTRELQALVDYGLERYIQVVPNVQAPAHMCYVLKHEKFAALRCDGSNYMACMEDPAALKLILDMYQDVCNATKGVDYFHVSTDEVYYAGICERFRKPYNPENRSLTFVEFVNRANEFLAQRGRRSIIWAEYPLLAQHVPLLPNTLIDGIIGGDFARREAQRGIRQLAYCSMQGEEKLFPSYFPYVERDGQRSPGRLADAYDSVLHGKSSRGDPIGTFAAAWDDAGLHNETFWLGWAAMAQNGWTPGAASVEQTTADFMDVYYGRSGADLAGIYRDMQQGSRFWEFVWERRPSKVRADGYGYSGGKRAVGRTDYTLSPPPLPNADDLSFAPAFAKRHQKTLAELPQRAAGADKLITALQAALTRVQRNRHNLEVYLSLAALQRQQLRMLATLQGAEELMAEAARLAPNQPQQAVSLLVQAHRAVGQTIDELVETRRQLTTVWEVSQYPRNRTVNGRAFLHVMDDVKDHFADRRKDLSYMTAPEEMINLSQWRDRLGETIKAFAKAKNVEVRGLAEKVLED